MATKDEAMQHGYRLLRQPVLALKQASEILRLYPGDAAGHRLTAMAKRSAGDIEGAIAAERQAVRLSLLDPELTHVARLMAAHDFDEAEAALLVRLKRDGLDPVAIRMLGVLRAEQGLHGEAARMLERAVQIMPSFEEARFDLANALIEDGRLGDAIAQIDLMEAAGPLGWAPRLRRATSLAKLGQTDRALADYDALVAEKPDDAGTFLLRGHLFKTMGEQARSVEAYRRAIALQPAMGSAWWSIANLKMVRFDEDDRAAMVDALDTPGLDPEEKASLLFALGKYHEDRGDTPSAWRYYAEGNQTADKPHSASAITRMVDRSIRQMTPAFFRRARHGCAAPDPIFILGMPRAGSTLIEQILASHSQVEGTHELGEMGMIAERIGAIASPDDKDNFPANLARVPDEQLERIGRSFIEATRIHRLEGRPLFTDKMPGNWQYIGLIRLILPNAKIIDARRHPLDCGFGNFKQHFAKGQAFSYDLGDIGHYYRDYVRLMDHVDKVQPGAVHRVIHEQLLEDPETEVRRMLAYCGLDYEEACLRFHENKRAVRTASAEQVRRPLTKKAVGRWKLYDAWLGPLKAALGPVLDSWDTPQPWANDAAA